MKPLDLYDETKQRKLRQKYKYLNTIFFADFNATCIDLNISDNCMLLTGYMALYKVSRKLIIIIEHFLKYPTIFIGLLRNFHVFHRSCHTQHRQVINSIRFRFLKYIYQAWAAAAECGPQYTTGSGFGNC